MILAERYRNWHYKSTFFLGISILLIIYFIDSPPVQNAISEVRNLGYLGAFLAGCFFVSTFTVAPAAVVLYFLADTLSPVEIAVFGGLGAVVGDYLIFRFLKDLVFEELKPLFYRITGDRFSRLSKNPYFTFLLPLLGAIVIASPFPDEVGIGMMGISNIKNWQFLILSFVLNSLGIFVLVAISRSI